MNAIILVCFSFDLAPKLTAKLCQRREFRGLTEAVPVANVFEHSHRRNKSLSVPVVSSREFMELGSVLATPHSLPLTIGSTPAFSSFP